MDISTFAQANRLKVKLDACRFFIIPGRRGHIYEGFDNGLGVYLDYPTARTYNFAAKLLLASGLVQRQDAECEGCFVFDPANSTQVRAAIRYAKVKPKREMSPEQLAVLEKARQVSGKPSARAPSEPF